MRNKINIYILFVFVGLLLLSACKSPMDIDSPTDDGEPIVKYRITPDMPDMYFDENGEQRHFISSNSFAQIDTLSKVPHVWMDLKFVENGNFSNVQDSFNISQFSIYLDSIPIIPFIEDTLNSSETESWSCFVIGKSGLSTDTLYSGMGRNLTRVSFTFDKSKREMKAFIYSNLVKKQSDTSFFRATLYFKY